MDKLKNPPQTTRKTGQSGFALSLSQRETLVLDPIHGPHLGWRNARIFFELPVKVRAVRVTYAESNIRRLLIGMQQELRRFLDAVLVQIIRKACADLLLKELPQIIRMHLQPLAQRLQG